MKQFLAAVFLALFAFAATPLLADGPVVVEHHAMVHHRRHHIVHHRHHVVHHDHAVVVVHPVNHN